MLPKVKYFVKKMAKMSVVGMTSTMSAKSLFAIFAMKPRRGYANGLMRYVVKFPVLMKKGRSFAMVSYVIINVIVEMMK